MTGHDATLRVLVVHNRYRSAQPSGENAVVDQEVALLDGAGHDVRTFERNSDDIADMSLVSRAALPLRVPWNGATRRDLAGELRAWRPDVVHVHNTFPLLSASVVAACADADVPVVATLHNYAQVCPRGTLFRAGKICTSCLSGSPVPSVVHGCYRDSALATVPVAVSLAANRRRWSTGVTRFFCISDAQRQTLIRGGLPADRLTVKHNFVPDPGVRRSGPGRHLLFLGRLAEEKGLPLLMTAWESLRGETGLPLVIAGAGPLEPQVRSWADGRADVRFVGLQDRAQCQALTADAVAVVVPSTWLETFGLVAVEAAAAGVPVVAADHGAFPELIDHHRTGLLHRPGDATSLASALRAVVDPARNSALGIAARERYTREFTPEVGLQRLIAGYREAMGDVAVHAP